uniref:Amino acid transporter transmembrane domain-containing protein n=1 Tax=Glossina palpalis gambiensis TaxID=67801 RepID=A0A1B0AYZ1_9MUSC
MDGRNYNAYEHRDNGVDKLSNCSNFSTKRNRSYVTALMHLMKFIWSTGMLIVPYAFQNIGWLMALGILIVIIALTTIGLHVMFNSMHALCCRHRVPYLNIHAALHQSINEGPLRLRSFRKYSRAILDLNLVIYYLGLSAAYVMFIAEVIKQFIDHYYYRIDLWIYIYLMAGLLLIVQLLQNFKSMVRWIMIPIALSHLALVVMILLICVNVSNINDKYFVNDLIKYPKFMGIILFTCCPVGVFLNVEEDMKEPLDFVKIFGVLNAFMLATFILAAILGLTGYWFYGEETAANIILNIPISQRLKHGASDIADDFQVATNDRHSLLHEGVVARTDILPYWHKFQFNTVPRCRRAKVCQLHSFRTKPQLVGYISMKHQLSATLPPRQHTSLPSPESLPSSDQQAKCSINQNRQKSRGGILRRW